MKLEIKELFEKLNIFLNEEEEKYFENAIFYKEAEFDRELSKLRVFIKLSDFLPIHILHKVESALTTNTFIPTKLNLEVENQNYTKELIWNHIEYIKDLKAEIKTGAIKILSPLTVEYFEDYRIIFFNVSNEIEKNLLEEHREYYKNKLMKYGFRNIDLDIKILEKNKKNVLENVHSDYVKSVELNTKSEIQKSENTIIDKKVASFRQKFVSNEEILNNPTYSKLVDLEENAQNITIHGEVISKSIRKSKAGRNIYNLSITDGSSSVTCIFFQKNNDPTFFDELTEETKEKLTGYENQIIRKGDWVSFNGKYNFSTFDKTYIFYIEKYKKIESKKVFRKDSSSEKRVEMHIHTKMSVMDGVSTAKDYIHAAKRFGWKAIALTDHLNVQTFPDAYWALQEVNKNLKPEEKIKLIYGSELSMLQENIWFIKNPKNQNLRKSKFVVLDLETTGLSPEYDEIIEFGANVYDYAAGTHKKYDILIKPKKKLKNFTIELTGITNEMLETKNSIEIEFKKIMEIIQNGILIAHNANFDFNFLQVCAKKFGYAELTNTVIDTLALSRILQPKLKNHRLGTVAKAYQILYDDKIAHRADYDAEVLTNVYEHMWNEAKKITSIDYDIDWNKFAKDKFEDENYKRIRGYHVNVLAKNNEGLKNLYKVISYSHVKNFLNSPKIFQSELLNFRKEGNILIGSGCINGLVFEYARTGTFEMLQEAISIFDYIEIQPLSVYKKLIQTEDLDLETLKLILKKIIEESKKQNKIIIATSDAHYVEPELKVIRDIYINTKGLGGVYHPLYDFKQRVKDNPDQHLRTTNEMLEEFKWLEDSELIHEIVIKNTLKISDMIDEDVVPIKFGLYTPKIENVDKLLSDECFKNAKELYGQTLPKIVNDRLEKELASIIKHGFAVVYWICHLLVKKSNEDGYLVGSRGSVGSSFVATTSKITEVNPLKAHYRCLKCKYSDFETLEEFKCGYDLPEKKCPNCNEKLMGDGHDIPFETFLGFDGDKVPDIDLNFSGEYQPIAHNFTKQMFGEENVFRAGTISTVAEKTAYGYTLGYLEKKQINLETFRKAEIERLAELSTGVKRTTGQHPGGIIILPKEFEIEDFTPVNFPADDSQSDWLTTHFDFHSIHDNLLKMDILGHVDPTALRMLFDLTNIDPILIPTDDKKVYSLFSELSALNLTPEQIGGETTGAIGLPEFGTQFVRAMLKETKPQTFADLVQISGLSHGTDVYVGNAQTLIRDGIANISSVIGCRDDIMVYLMNKNIDSSTSFKIMESVRKGNGLSGEWINIMKKHNVPDWYINSCLKIKYMFPKAHATAYVLMAYRVAWYKIYYPEEYYATWFTTRSDFFDLESCIGGINKIKVKMEDIKYRINAKLAVSAKENGLLTIYEVLIEMLERGIEIKNIDFNISDAMKFVIVKDENTGKKVIYPPFNVIDSLGEAVANSIVKARTQTQIVNVNDLKQRTQVTQTQIEIFSKLKITDNLKDDEQLSFDF
ncbi:PolC-type DNA polymerase III [Spiroplasma taiwanense]|uniref:DNA polymerase III PolC-type n=1 Tax=Spiroplasma taiwanense CT-1 TaxID=1276220 RepID=S5LUF8_9MOLU|nr:PolC-type DNA polymerase III [Spiroplasma taiwanense]AGR41424.1 DNA polymerase III subunit alpha (PolC) [Spiroplasma taiwanense CT-1]